MSRPTLDDYYVEMAELVAQRSKDLVTKVGCVIVGPDKEIRATGYNGFPRGVKDDIESRHQRPAKYRYTEHSERNAVFNACLCGISLKGCVLYLNQWLPCADCARAIIQVGIKEVVTKNLDTEYRWLDSITDSVEMLYEVGINIRLPNCEPCKYWDLMVYLDKVRQNGP